jgi:hypothetical protein
MAHAGRYRVPQPRWQDEWLKSVTQALAVLTFSVLLRWVVL